MQSLDAWCLDGCWTAAGTAAAGSHGWTAAWLLGWVMVLHSQLNGRIMVGQIMVGPDRRIMVGQMVGCRSSCVGNGLTAGSCTGVPDKLHYNGLKFYIFRQLLSYFEAAMIKSAASAASLAGRKNNKDLKASSFL